METLKQETIDVLVEQCLVQEAKTGVPHTREFVDAVTAHCPNCVASAGVSELPVFRQGAPSHEVEGYVTADMCTWMVAEIERLRGLIQEKAERSNPPDTELLDKLNKLAVV